MSRSCLHCRRPFGEKNPQLGLPSRMSHDNKVMVLQSFRVQESQIDQLLNNTTPGEAEEGTQHKQSSKLIVFCRGHVLESQMKSWRSGQFRFDPDHDPHKDAPILSREATCRCCVAWCNANDITDLSSVYQYTRQLKSDSARKKAFKSFLGVQVSSEYLDDCLRGKIDLRIHLRHVPVVGISQHMSSSDRIHAWIAQGCILSIGTDASALHVRCHLSVLSS
jgi:hypothetical protein